MSCNECGSQIQSIRLCLQCRTAHTMNLFSNRDHIKIECMNYWHSWLVDKHQEVIAIAKKERKRGIKWSYYDYFIMSFLSFLGVGLLFIVWKLIF